MFDQVETTVPAYAKPEIKSYTESEVLESMEAWGISAGGSCGE